MTLTPVWGWVIGYAAIGGLTVASIALRREATLVRGRDVLTFGIVYWLLAFAAAFSRTGAVSPALASGALIVLAGSAAAAPFWFLVKAGDRTALGGLIETCTARVCATASVVPAGYDVSSSAGTVSIRLAFRGPLVVMRLLVRPAHRKGTLLSRLVRKQFRGPLPRLRIRLK